MNEMFGDRHRLVLHHLRRAQRVAAVNHGDLGGELRQVDRLFHRGVAAADHGDRQSLEEEPVAGRAGRDAAARQLLVDAEIEPLRRRAGRDDQRVRDVPGLVDVDDERALRQVDRRDVALDDLGAEALGLRAQLLHQVGPHDAVAVAGPVLDHRGQHQLTAGFDAFDDERLQIGARRVERGCQSGRAGADDDDLAFVRW